MSSRAVVVSLFSVLALAVCGQRSTQRGPDASASDSKTAATASAPGAAPQADAPATEAPAAATATATAGSTPDAPDREALIEPSRDLGGALPLKHGVFVSGDSACGDPPNAALRRYDGQGLSGAHTHACQIKVLAQHGAAYDIEQSCIDAGQGPAPRTVETATIDIQDHLTFALKRGGDTETFRYCAASMLPPSLRTW